MLPRRYAGAFGYWLTADAQSPLHGPTRPNDSLQPVGLHRTVLGALGAERLKERVVALVAVVGQQLASLEWRQRIGHRERPRVGHGIVHGRLVLEDVVGQALEAFGDLHLRAVTIAVAVEADGRPVSEIRGFDHELVAFPVRTRIPKVLAYRLV